MKNGICLIVAVAFLAIAGCTSNEMARKYGGTITIDLPPGQKLENATWKENNLWYLTRQSRDGEKPEVLTFQEDSRFGIMNGKVVFRER